jgi:predicted site-specific integrase-resolvase
MKLADWARQEGIDYKTAFRWFKAGILPLPSTQLPTGTILVHLPKIDETKETKRAALYARVSSHDQKDDLQRQLARLVEYATKNSYNVVETSSEIGSALNGNRKKLLGLLKNKDIDVIIVEHQDRLSRFGVEYIQALLETSGRKILIVEDREITNDLVQDMIDVLTSFCARLYGKRSAKNKAKKVIEDLQAKGASE